MQPVFSKNKKMFGYDSLIDIRDLELFLYDGPETAEQVFERNDSFSADHKRRRYHKDRCVLCEKAESEDLWYSYSIDVKTNTIEYHMQTEE